MYIVITALTAHIAIVEKDQYHHSLEPGASSVNLKSRLRPPVCASWTSEEPVPVSPKCVAAENESGRRKASGLKARIANMKTLRKKRVRSCMAEKKREPVFH